MYQACIKVLALLMFVSAVGAEPHAFKEGEHYDKIDPRILNNEVIRQHISQDKNKVQVVEFLSYGCYWCSQIHQPLSAWAQANSTIVAMYHYPAVFNQLWSELGKIYLTVQHLENATEIDEKIFTAIHSDRVSVWQETEIKKIIVENGGNFEIFEQYFNSFVIINKLKKSEQLANAYKIDATPYIIVHGPHASYTTSLSKTRDKDVLIQVVDYLVMREQKFYQEPTTRKG